MGRVIHFEITADDVPRAKKFYEIFGWQISNAAMPELEPNKYMVAKTGDGEGTDGAIMTREFRKEPVIIWIKVNDLDETIDQVQRAGGKLAGEKQSVPGIGQTIYISDTEGNTIGLLQPLSK